MKWVLVFTTAIIIAGVSTAADQQLLNPEAVEPADFKYWSSKDLQAYTQKLAPKINDNKVSGGVLGQFDNYTVYIGYREGSGSAEWHANQTDLYIVQDGEATLLIGGELVDGKPRPEMPGEMSGTSIKGGTSIPLAPGDMVHVGAKTPHQVLVDEGQYITYALVKVDIRNP